MEKICVVCGKKFEAQTNRAKYCSKVCSNHSRFKQTQRERHEKAFFDCNEVEKLYNLGLNDIQIAEQLERSITWVRNVRLELGLKKQLTLRQKEVLELRNQGKCCVEISDLLGMECKNVNAIARKIGKPFTKEEIERSIEIGKIKAKKNKYGNFEKYQIEYIEEHHPLWIWVSGSHGGNDFMELKCKECNSIIRKSAVTVRKAHNLICPVCLENRKQRKMIEQEKRREQSRHDRFWNQSFNQVSLNINQCINCGTSYIGKSKFCSDECRKRRLNQRHDNRIKMKRKGDITLDKLYKRDNGMCWICGESCNYSDCRTDNKGNFIVGKNYPSIDHVYPLSKGGLHTWDNVKLAHHYCNTVKNDKVVC